MKKKQDIQEEKDSAPENGEPVAADVPEQTPPPRKKSFLRRLLRWTLSLVVMLVLIVAGLAAILTYYFPSEEIRPIAEDQLMTHLKMPVKIGQLEFNLLTGFELVNVQLGEKGPENDGPLFHVDRVILGYDLRELLDGSFTVHRIQVQSPRINLVSNKGVWNFQPLLDLAGPPAAQPPPSEPGKLELPVIPIPVKLTEFAINNIQFNARMDDTMTAHVGGLSLEAKGKADTQGIDVRVRVHMGQEPHENDAVNISYFSKQGPAVHFHSWMDTDIALSAQDINRALATGTLGLTDVYAKLDQVLPKTSTRLDFATAVNLEAQVLDLTRVALSIGRANRVALAGQVRQFMGHSPDFNLTLPKGEFDLVELTSLAKPFMPPMSVTGKLSLTDIDVRGRLKNYQPDKITMSRARIDLADARLRHPATKTRLSGLGMGMDLKNIRLNGTVPETVEVTGDLSVTEGESFGVFVERLKHAFNFKGSGANLADMESGYATDVEQISTDVPQLGEVAIPLKLKGKFKGNMETGAIDEFGSTVDAGPLLKSVMALKAKEFGRGGFSLTNIMESDLESVRRLVPPDMEKEFGLGVLQGKLAMVQKASGNLDKEFMPVNLTGDARTSIVGLHAELTQPAFSVTNLNTEMRVPVELIAKKGVRLPGVDFKGSLDSVKALGQYEAGATQFTSFMKLDKYLPLEGNLGRVPLEQKFTLKSTGIVGAEPEIRVDAVALQLDSRADMLPPGDAENISTTGRLNVSGMSAMQQFSAEGFETDFSMEVKDLNLQKTHARVKGRVVKPSVKQEDMQLALEDLQFETRSRQNLKSGDVELGLLNVVLPGVVDWRTKGTIESWGEHFDVETRMDRMDLEKLLALVPEKFKEAIAGMKLAGAAVLEAKAKGAKPDEVALKKMEIPVTVDSKLKLADIHVEWPERNLLVEGLNFDTALTLADNNINLSGKTAAKGITKTDLEPGMKLTPEFDFHYKVDNWDTVKVERHALKLPGQNISHAISGRVEGLRPFLSGKKEKTPHQFLKTLDVALKTSLGVDMGTVAPMVPGVKAEGTVNSNLDVTLIAGQEVNLNGEIDIGHLNAEHSSGGKVEDLDGRFMINKKLLLDRLLYKDQKQFSASRRGFFNELREFSPYKNIFRVGALKFGPHTASNIGMDIYYRGNQLFLDRFLMEVLGGGVAGNLFLSQTPEGPELEFATDFAHIDFNKLVKNQVSASERDAEVDGNLKFNFKVNQGSANQKINLDQIGLELNITHIGKQVLDRILLFIDPEESSPAIVDTRSKLDLAIPQNMHVKVAYGNLSMDIGMLLLGNPIEAPALRRVPVTSLKHFRQINEQLQMLKDFQYVLHYLSANGIEFDDEGNITFF